jgi:two-component system phosphate regulon sensor histidine kinase PhoR
MRSRLFYKVFATYLSIIVLVVSILFLLVGREVKNSSTQIVEAELLAYAQVIDLSSPKDIGDKIQALAGASRSRVTLIDAQGNVLADSERPAALLENHISRPEIQEAKVKGKGSAIRFSSSVGTDMLNVAVSIPDERKTGISGYVRIARPLYEVKRSLDGIYRSFFAAILLAVPLSVLSALIFSYRITSPIRNMEEFTEKLRRGSIPGTLLVNTSDEVRQLAENINYLVSELQEKIRMSNEEQGKLAAAFAGMMEGVLILDSEDKIEVVNRAFVDMFASQYGNVRGKTLIEAFRSVEVQNIFSRYKQTGIPLTDEITLGTDKTIILDIGISPIREEDKTMIVFHDVTRLKKLEKMRVDFVANVTHEIRTPLTAIIGFVETLQEGAIDENETAKDFLEIIARHATRLNRLVDDLLTLSDIELGETRFFFENVSLGDVLENVIPMIEEKAGSKKIALTKELPDNLPPVRADRDRLIQILLNVLDNAVKFTPESGRVSLSVSAADKNTIVVRIGDTGVGVPRGELSRLGERFYRVDKTRSRELGGTGLGLSIVKHLMAAHGGKMEIESQVGRGTVVSLIFPVAKETG